MGVFGPYGAIKDLAGFVLRESLDNRRANYGNYKFFKRLKALRLIRLEDKFESIYLHALFNFSCLGYDEEWVKILAQHEVIEAYYEEFVQRKRGSLDKFQSMIEAELHSMYELRSLRDTQRMDTAIFEAFQAEFKKVADSLRTVNAYEDRSLIQSIHDNLQEKKEKKDTVEAEAHFRKYLKGVMANRQSARKAKNIDRFYIELLGEEALIQVKATEYWEPAAFAPEDLAEAPNTQTEPISDTISNLARNFKRIVLRGDPGAGKSFSLEKIYYEHVALALANDLQAKIPVLLEAKHYVSGVGFKAMLKKALKLPEHLPDDIFNHPKLLFLIDGLNEVGLDHMQSAIRELKALMDEYGEASFLLTARKYDFESYRFSPESELGLKIFDIRPINEDEIVQYIREHAGKAKGNRIWKQIKKRPKVRLIAANPMYLRMLLAVAVSTRKQEIPRSKGELYHKFMDRVLSWEDHKLPAGRRFNRDAKVRYLSHLAYAMINERTMTRNRVLAILDELINDIGKASVFLEELLRNYLIRDLDTDSLSFVHDTYSEYFAAVALASEFEIKGRLSPDLSRQQWFESIRMCSDIIANEDKLFAYVRYLTQHSDGNEPAQKHRLTVVNGKENQLTIAEIPRTLYNPNIHVACRVAFHIYFESNRANKDRIFRYMEGRMGAYMTAWMHHYEKSDEEVIPVEQLFAAISALSSEELYFRILTEREWTAIWCSFDVANFKELYQLTDAQSERLANIQERSAHALVNGASDFFRLYFILTKRVPNHPNYSWYQSKYAELKGLLLVEAVRNNLDNLKRIFKKVQDYDVLKVIGYQDLRFYVQNVQQLEVHDETVSHYLRQELFMDKQELAAFDELPTLREKLAYISGLDIDGDTDVEKHLVMARYYRGMRQYKKATRFYRRVLEVSPANVSSLVFVVNHFRRTGNFRPAIKLLQNAVKEADKSEFLLRYAARFCLSARYPDLAIEYGLRLAERYGEDPIVLGVLAYAYFQNEDYERALSYVTRAMDIGTDQFALYALAGDLYKKTGDVAKAIHYFDRYLLQFPNNAIIWGNLGEGLMQLERFEDAILAFEQELKLKPDNPVAIGMLGTCHKRLENHAEAIALFERLMVTDPKNQLLIGNLGDSYKKLGNHEKAIEYFEMLLDIDAYNSLTLGNIADSYKKLGNHEKAIEYFEMLIEIEPDNFLTRGNIADSYKKLGNHKKAIEYFEATLADGPMNSLTLGNIADSYKRSGEYEKALEYLALQLETDPENAMILGNIADTYKKLGNHEKAIEYFRASLQFEPGKPMILGNIADSYKKLGNHEKAIEYFVASLEFEPENTRTLGNIGDSYKKLGNHEKAIEYFAASLEHDPTNPAMLGSIADSYKKLGKYEQSIAYFVRLLDVEPNKAMVQRTIADSYKKLGNHEKAIEYLEASLQTEPDSPLTLGNIADSYKKLGNHEKAIEYSILKLEVDPDNPLTLGNIADSYKKLGNHQKAIQYLKLKLEIEPENPLTLGNIGDSYKKLDHHDKAIEYFERLLAVEPNNALTLGNIADSYKKLGNQQKAIQYLKLKLEIEPENPLTLGNIGDSYKKLDHHHKAIEYFERQLAVEPDNALTVGNIADSYKKQGNHEKAIEYLELQLSFDPTNTLTLGNIADSYRKTGKVRIAIQYFELSIKNNTDNAQSLFGLADSLLQIGKYAQAIVYFREVLRVDPSNLNAYSRIRFCEKQLS